MVHLAQGAEARPDAPRLAARRHIEAALADGDLDAFVAGYFLARYGNERIDLQAPARRLVAPFEFSRSHVAMLGVALERGWVDAHPDTVAAFTDGADRLERQKQIRGVPGVDHRSSVRLLWGMGLGASVAAVEHARPDLRRTIAGHLRRMREGSPRVRDRVLLTAALAEIDPEHRDEQTVETARQLLALERGSLLPADAAAVAWAVELRCFGGPTALGNYQTELNDLLEVAVPRAMRAEIADIFDALLAESVSASLLRALRNAVAARRTAIDFVLEALDQFPVMARRLANRKHGRHVFAIENEYDVQDLLFVALKPGLTDLTDEEWTPKDAGAAKRIDFMSASAALAIEAKMVRDAKHAKAIADELRQDFESYYVHESCRTLVVFVYDPEGLIADPVAIERDLSGLREIKGRRMDVLVRIRPR